MTTRRQQADEAYARNEAALEGRAPVPEGTLPGQIDMDGTIAGVVPGARPRVSPDGFRASGIPESCPGCYKPMTIESGWTALHPRDDEGPDTRFIQCGACGLLLMVPPGPWETLRLAVAARFGRSDLAPVKPDTRGRKTRGAG